ncbi:hypothetical protein [Amycolatopsis thermoflava]|uniref:hypothetical protein n=1 Tax=Amycolatopsis thermoflava TaxID=84480 RepID=UPI003821519F
MTDWGPTITQIVAGPLIATAATYVVASAVVKKQSIGKARMDARSNVAMTVGKILLEADTYLYKSQSVGNYSLDEIYYYGFQQCYAILRDAKYLSWFDRRKVRRYCARMFGVNTLRVASYYPAEGYVIDVGDRLKVTLADGVDELVTDLTKGTVLQQIFRDDFGVIFPRATDRNVHLDLQGRGLVNVFRLAERPEALYWGPGVHELRLKIASDISIYSRAMHDFALKAIWL